MRADYSTLVDSWQDWFEGTSVAIDSVLAIEDLTTLTPKTIASFRNGKLMTAGRVVDIELPEPRFTGEPLDLVIGPYCLHSAAGFSLVKQVDAWGFPAAILDLDSDVVLCRLGEKGWEAADNPERIAVERVLIRQPASWLGWKTRIVSLLPAPPGPRSRLSPLAAGGLG
jgi:hypothetical protein